MADSTFRKSDKFLKLRELEDGTFAQSVQVENTVTVQISGDGITIENVDIEGLDSIENIGTVNTVSTVEQVSEIGVLLEGTVTIEGTTSVEGVVTVDGTTSIEGVVTVEGEIDTIKTVSVVEEIISVGTLLDGTVTIENANFEVSGTVSVEEISVGTILDGTLTKIEEIVKVGTILDGTVSISNQDIGVIGTVTVESLVLTSVSHTSASLTTDSSTTVLNDNPNRQYAVVFNPNGTPIFVGLGKVATGMGGGIYVPEDSAYEMSAGFGNLHKGQISVIKPSGDGLVFITEGE